MISTFFVLKLLLAFIHESSVFRNNANSCRSIKEINICMTNSIQNTSIATPYQVNKHYHLYASLLLQFWISKAVYHLLACQENCLTMDVAFLNHQRGGADNKKPTARTQIVTTLSVLHCFWNPISSYFRYFFI